MQQILKIKSKINDYDLEVVRSIDDIVRLTKDENVITIIDRNICKLYTKLSDDSFIQVECIEENKNLKGAEYILDELIKRKANVSTKLIVIGGGILQDLAGLCATIYCRGIDYTLIPTTLLAQVDSCIGGKTSLNYKNRKNILGTFYPPSKILICTDFLNTLSKLDYLSGCGEIYKFHILQGKINSFNPYGPINEMIIDGLRYKSSILSLDEFDKGERKYLNFGHTFGHALETASNHEVPHGVAVIIGSMIAVMISKELGYDFNDYQSIIDKGKMLLNDTKLSFESKWFDLDTLLEIVKSDKKNTGKLTMVLISDKPFLKNIDDVSVLQKVLKQIYEII